MLKIFVVGMASRGDTKKRKKRKKRKGERERKRNYSERVQKRAAERFCSPSEAPMKKLKRRREKKDVFSASSIDTKNASKNPRPSNNATSGYDIMVKICSSTSENFHPRVLSVLAVAPQPKEPWTNGDHRRIQRIK
jgi:hypothetical protein